MATDVSWREVLAVDELFDVRGRVALVTGATAGLGRRMAAVLHGAGARVAIAGRRGDRLDEVAATLPGTCALTTDAGDDEALVGLVETATDRLGPIEILVNNAGTAFAATAQDERRDHIERTLAVNLVAPFRLAQLVHAPMAAGGRGSIVNVSSIAASGGIGGRLPQAGYAASKGGVEALTRELAAQWARDGIRVNAIAPGFFASEMTEGLLASEPIHDFVLRNSMIRRVGTVGDFDGALLFLASDASAFVTGQTLHVDGGWSAR